MLQQIYLNTQPNIYQMKKIFTLLLLLAIGYGSSATPVFQMSIDKVSSSATKYRIIVRMTIYDPANPTETFSLANSNYAIIFPNTILANPVGISTSLVSPSYQVTVTQPNATEAWFNPVKNTYGQAFGFQFPNVQANPGCGGPGGNAVPNSELVTIEFDVLPGQANAIPVFNFNYKHDINGTIDTQTWIDKTLSTGTPPFGGFPITPVRILAALGGEEPLPGNASLITCPSTLAPAVPLPVSLLSFTAAKNNSAVALNWLTASEQNSSLFEVERSTNGETYTRIGVVRAAGNSSTKLSYQLNDNEPYLGLNYYRLKMVDTDGSFEYSEVRQVNFGNRDLRILSAYPNPAQNEIVLNVAAPKGYKNAQLRILNAQGSVAMSQDVTEDLSDDYINLNISALAKGVYLAEIASEKQVVRTRFVKQ